ncbi:MAG: TlpA family protein disulfide reductase [Acidimicrobiaceae bacterium]|nr:TlpA family protein disulfide reductase [Acidimicrobiaceae bacterium]
MSSQKINSTGSNKTVWLIGGIVAAVAIAAVIAIASTSSKQDSGLDVAQGIEEFHSVEVTGEALPEYPDGGNDGAVGMTAPELTGQGFTSNKITTTAGAPTLLVFLAHWCPHCQYEVPLLVQWERDGLVPAGVDVIAVSTSTDPAAPNFPPSEWLAREEWPPLWPVMTDSGEKTAATAFGVTGFPFFVLVDASGKVAMRSSGRIEMPALTELINQALGV